MKGITPGKQKDMHFPFGAHNGKLVCDVDTAYLLWIKGEKWFQDKFPLLLEQVEIELEYRKDFPKKEDK